MRVSAGSRSAITVVAGPKKFPRSSSGPGSNAPQVRTRYEYRPTGWVSRSIDKDGSPDPQELSYDYDLAGNQIEWASPGRTRRVGRDFFPNGELEQRRAVRTDRDGTPVVGETRTYDYAHNPAGELTSLIDHNAPRPDNGATTRLTSVTRDVAGRVRRVNESWDGGRDSVYHFQTGGLIEDVSVDGRISTTGAFEGGRMMSYGYDILDRVKDVSVRETGAPASGDRVTRMTYWPSDAQRELTKANKTVETRYFADDGRITQRPTRPTRPAASATSPTSTPTTPTAIARSTSAASTTTTPVTSSRIGIARERAVPAIPTAGSPTGHSATGAWTQRRRSSARLAAAR